MHKEISQQTSLPEWKVQKTVALLAENNTVHFIARYRKEQTGNVNEEDIRLIIDVRDKIEKLSKAKETALKNIAEQKKLTPKLQKEIELAQTLTEVEDLYAPYKRAKKTKADVAVEKGFGPLAQDMKKIGSYIIPSSLKKYGEEEIAQGVQDILNQEVADNPLFKKNARFYFSKQGVLTSTFTKNDHEQKNKFTLYEDFSSPIPKIKSHQLLALNRGESLKILSVKLHKDEEFFKNNLSRYMRLEYSYLKEGCKKIFASVENELRKELTQKAIEQAVVVFQDNLKQLLLLKPHYGTEILAIDPGFRTGCKICTINKEGKAENFTKIFVHKEEEAVKILQHLARNKIIVVGNGTGSKECCELLAKNFENEVIVVNESGASVYSTSKAGQEEFPSLDATDRGTISIGKRYVDCLSELVKIPVTSIGVGLYQHDMPQKQLEEKLKTTVEDVVNLVGVNVNTASVYLLSYISGLNKKTAKKICDNAPYASREELEKILSKKTYQQAIGFLRVVNEQEPLDNTSIHPEQYVLAKEIIVKKNFLEVQKKFPELTKETYDDILHHYNQAGKELRTLEGNKNKQRHLDIEKLRVDDVVEGIVRNIIPFGAFVDIGLKNDGLLHISELAERFVKDPREIVAIGQEVRVKIIKIDMTTGKTGLSLKQVD